MELFSYFDRDGGGSIGVEELGQIMKTFHWNPSDSEIKVTLFDICSCIIFNHDIPQIYLSYFLLIYFVQDLFSSVDQNGDGSISFNEFVGLMEAEPHDDDLRDQIREAFRVFDEQDLGYIPADNLTEILTSIGDKLTKGMNEPFK